MITLYDHQKEMVGNVRQAFRYVRNVLLQSPTGSGKTVMAASMIHSSVAKGNKVFFICHRKEILDQTSLTMEKFEIDHGFIAANYPVNYFKQVQLCSIDTLKNRLESIPKPNLCIWDESHHICAAGWTKVHEHLSSSYHLGLSATPCRLDGKGLNERFDFLVPGPQTSWLIDNGYLADYRLLNPTRPDMSGVGISMGKFISSQSESVMDKPSIMGNIVETWKSVASDKLTIGFAVSRKHSQKIVDAFNDAGIPAVHLDGETPKAERRDKLRSFARGDIRIVFNVGLFGEGFDISANSGMDVTVGCVIDAAPTMALGAWLQRCGRALRKQEGRAIIIDHSGNSMRHGMPCMDRVWTLEGKNLNKKEREEEEASLPIKQCPKCYEVHRPSPSCPSCGHTYEVKHMKIKEISGELNEVDPKELRKQARMEQGQAGTLAELEALAKARGKSPRMAQHILRAREEKKKLQDELFNLSVGAKIVGIDLGLNRREINKLKPKALKEKIEWLNDQMRDSPQFN